jgi:hypothetical protein
MNIVGKIIRSSDTRRCLLRITAKEAFGVKRLTSIPFEISKKIFKIRRKSA